MASWTRLRLPVFAMRPATWVMDFWHGYPMVKYVALTYTPLCLCLCLVAEDRDRLVGAFWHRPEGTAGRLTQGPFAGPEQRGSTGSSLGHHRGGSFMAHENPGKGKGRSRAAMRARIGAQIEDVQSQLEALGDLSGSGREVRDKAIRHLDAAYSQIADKPDVNAAEAGQPSDGDVKGRARSAMCARIGAHIAYVQSQLNALGDLSDSDRKVRDKANRQLEAARSEITEKPDDNPEGIPRRRRLWRRVTKTDVVTALTNVHEAEVELTKLLKSEELKSRFPQILTHAREYLPSDDPQRNLLEEEWEQSDEGRRHLPADAKGVAVETLHAANKVQEEERIRLRSFTQILVFSIVVMLLFAIGFGIWASVSSDIANLFCFERGRRPSACPLGRYPADGSDVFLIEFMGMFAAALAGATSLSTMRGNSSPYHVSVLLLLLRLPVGAMTAVLGILLVRGAFFPGLTNLDASAQIIAWAAAFGILQEPVTRAVDKTGRSFLEELTPYEEAKAPPGSARHHHRRKSGDRRKKRR